MTFLLVVSLLPIVVDWSRNFIEKGRRLRDSMSVQTAPKRDSSLRDKKIDIFLFFIFYFYEQGMFPNVSK